MRDRCIPGPTVDVGAPASSNAHPSRVMIYGGIGRRSAPSADPVTADSRYLSKVNCPDRAVLVLA